MKEIACSPRLSQLVWIQAVNREPGTFHHVRIFTTRENFMEWVHVNNFAKSHPLDQPLCWDRWKCRDQQVVWVSWKHFTSNPICTTISSISGWNNLVTMAWQWRNRYAEEYRLIRLLASNSLHFIQHFWGHSYNLRVVTTWERCSINKIQY